VKIHYPIISGIKSIKFKLFCDSIGNIAFSFMHLGWMHFLDQSYCAILVMCGFILSSLCLAKLCFSERKWL